MKSMQGRLIGFAFAALAALAQLGAQAPSVRPDDARARIKEITTRVEGLVGVRGADRTAALEKAASDYEAVATEFATDKSVVAQASWEAGECWRRANKVDLAAEAYARVLASGEDRFRQRALFQRASMLRRTKQLEEAGKLYAEAGKIDPESVRAHDARLWVARVLELRGDNDGAVSAYRGAVEAAVGARRVIEASDALAKSLVRKGDLDGAKAAIEHAEHEAADEVEAGGEEGERIKKSLDEMGSRGMLRRAVDKKTKAAGAAIDLENARGR
ncbi:MAG: tetratricopeptide repeat protein [Planctomycetota bacterium]